MSRAARIITWNGKGVPPELLDLPAGRYRVETIDDRRLKAARQRLAANPLAPTLTVEEVQVEIDAYRTERRRS